MSELAGREANRSRPLTFVLLAVLSMAILMPLAPAAADEARPAAEEADSSGFVPFVIGDISNFEAEVDGRQYLYRADLPTYSATRWLAEQWEEAGRPFLEDEPEQEQPESSTSGRAHSGCTPTNEWTAGQSGNVQISGGSIDVVAEKVTTNAAFLVDVSATVSVSTLNSFATDWESTVFPTDTSLFLTGNMPDKDGNCQVEIVIYNMDGAGGTGGYFSPGIASGGESLFVDAADTSGTFGKVILAHEFEHLLHFNADPSEYLWIDEGNADMAAFFCFGMDSTLRGHINAWTQSTSTSVRWWNQKADTSDYGAGMLFMLYLHDMLGGPSAMKQLVGDAASGGASISNLAMSPPSGSSPIGISFSDIYGNFSIAAALDSDQSPHGFDSLDMTPQCGGTSSVCVAQPTETRTTWNQGWTSSGATIEGWGLSIFKMIADGNQGKLNLKVSSDQVAMGGKLVEIDSNGIISASTMQFLPGPDGNGDGNPDFGYSTGLIPGFGNGIDEVYAIVWFESAPSDCNYEDCYSALPAGFSSYPTSTVSIEANVITGPPTLTPSPLLNYSDADGDGAFDTLQIDTYVTSQAYSEKTDVLLEVYDSANNLVDSASARVIAGGGSPVTFRSWFVPAFTDTYTIVTRLIDLTGVVIDTRILPDIYLENMRPVADGDLSEFDVQTWAYIQFSADGYDRWGLTTDNTSLPHDDSPVAYEWSFGDGAISTLKNPRRYYTAVGNFSVTLRVQDQGGAWSEMLNWYVLVSDDSPPQIKLRADGDILQDQDQLVVFTDQTVVFSAYRTNDNVPIDLLDYAWDFGDGVTASGVGMYEVLHEWSEGESDGRAHILNLTLSDGRNSASIEVEVLVMNQPPRQIFTGSFETFTLMPVTLPDVFVDDDGMLTGVSWQFEGEVNLDGTGVTIDSIFNEPSTSNDANPTPAWKYPGVYNVTISATDDDGNVSIAVFLVTVINQPPVPLMTVFDDFGSLINLQMTDLDAGRSYTYDAGSSYDPDSSDVLTYDWYFSDNTSYPSIQAQHTFTDPGSYSVTLVVNDSQGAASVVLERVIRVTNPPPIIDARILEAWLDGDLVNPDTPRDENSTFIFTSAFTGAGEFFAAPGTLLFFDSSGTRDGDMMYASMSNPDPLSAEWNGIVEYYWDFGDASPTSNESSPWHAFTSPGTYIVTLTVRDGFGTGDTTQHTMAVRIDRAPEFDSVHFSSGIGRIVEGFSIAVEASASDVDLDEGLVACRDMEPFHDADGDGIEDNDCDEDLNSELTFKWDFDSRFEDATKPSEMDGDTLNDFVISKSVEHSWNATGNTVITLLICDDLDHCTTEIIPIKILMKQTDEEENEFDFANPKSYFMSDLGSSSMLFLGMILVVLILGYLVMRQPKEGEEDAEDAAEDYDVESVAVKGGVMGMDHHTAPPKPAVLDKEERKSDDSGYVRPVKQRK